MKPSRRDVLVGLGAAGLVAGCKPDSEPDTRPPEDLEPAPDRNPEPDVWDPGGAQDADAFGHGVQAGEASSTGALLSVRTTELGCELVVVAQDGDGWVEVERIGPLDPQGASVQVELTALVADTAHRYTLFAEDGARRSEVGRFRTALGVDSPPRKVVFGATSCWGSINPEFPSLGAAANLQLDAMLLLGDTVYADGSVTVDDYRVVWDRQLAKEHVRALFGSTSVIATWDDHEVENNWELGVGVSPAQYDAALEAFREAVPMGVGPSGSGLWRTVRWGNVVEIFVMDSRGERSDGKICSDEQLDVMTEALRASSAQFKLVLCSVHLTDHSQILGPAEEQDRWQGYPIQRERLVRACEETPGTLAITGDMHYSAVQLLGRTGEPGEQVVEIAAGPAGSRVVPMQPIVDLAVEPTPQYVWVGDTWTATVITFDPGMGQVRIEFIDDDGTVVFDQTF